MPFIPSSRSALLAFWLGYVAFIIYGSFIPFNFRPLPLDGAWAMFEQTPMLKLGIESRADWIANGVLYAPVGFLTAWLFASPLENGREGFVVAFHPGRVLLAGLFCIGLALGVEFTQLFFPPRTVSLNDLLAEAIGSGIGLIAASLSPAWIGKFLHAHRFDPERIFWHLVEAFLVAYVAFSLFPYDVLVSLDELTQKAKGTTWGVWLAGEAPLDLQSYFKLCAEVVLTLPFGIYIGHRLARGHEESKQPDGIRHSGFRRNDVASLAQAAVWGALLGIALELTQFFIATGVTQGMSVLTRMIGTAAGLALWQRRSVFTPDRLALTLRRHALPLTVLYIAALLLANGWFSYRWRGIEFAAAQLTDLRFLPFYYHYYTTEARALFSLASVILMYLPVGILTWANRRTPVFALWLSVLLAGIVETGKLFLQGTHPDPTNIPVAGVFAWLAVLGADKLSNAANPPPTPNVVSENSAPPSGHQPGGKASGNKLAYFGMLAILTFCAYRAATFPVAPVIISLILAASAFTVWHRPAIAFLLIPLALPVFDLAPWSGRFYFDEFDFLVLTCLAVGYARVAPPPKNTRRDPMLVVCLTLGGLSLILSTAIALFPWPASNENAFVSYFSPFNALRIVKGALWAFLGFGLIRRLQADGQDVMRPWALGMTGGLALTVAVVIWERLTFAGLFDFASDYRVTGPFSAMHVGGAYVEGFIVVATPFLLLLIMQTTSRINRLLGFFLLLATAYALMVTYSRGGYAAFAVALAVFLCFATIRSGQPRRGILAVAVSTIVLTVAIPVLNGEFARQRLASVGHDFGIRKAHWVDALAIRSSDWRTTLFGMGIGRFPGNHYLFSREQNRTGTYRLQTENGNTFLRLAGGSALYVEQVVAVDPQQSYRLKMDVRGEPPPEKITVSLCEKWMLTSFRCVWKTLAIPQNGNDWNDLQTNIATGILGTAPWYAARPVKLTLHTPPSPASHYDIDNIRLETNQGENLLRNGNFATTLDRWFFTVDDHLPWHTKNLPLAIFFDLGWFGLAALGGFALLAIARAANRAWQGDLPATAALSAFTAFLVVGLFDTLVDAPRFLFLFILLGMLCGKSTHSAGGNIHGIVT
ncbi:VanZ family protein [Propionivibrio limicola]|uniref:VanZ family protein n=1 Tax=Propionivibrio limicola TaxID=167645 RepID=UPI0012910E80|nr:VanZ family protein [Propionivibrio limicola]